MFDPVSEPLIPPMMWTVTIPFIDPVVAARALSHLPDLAFLDSAMRHDTLGRTSTLAADPFARFRFRDGQASLDGKPMPESGLDALRTCLAPYHLPRDAWPRTEPELPTFSGGAIGYLAYDLGAALEAVVRPARRAGLCDDIAVNLYDVVLSIDHEAGLCRLIATGFPETNLTRREARARHRLVTFANLLANPRQPDEAVTRTPSSESSVAWRSNFTDQRYESAVDTVRDYIRAGDIYQANIAQRFETDLPTGFDPLAFYERLRTSNPAPFGAYLASDNLSIASSSPERFLKLSGRSVETRPIKGTVRRVADPDEDRRLADALQADVKERAENIMIVDLLRNDLSRVCEPHSVQVPVLCGLESYASVHHLVSVVTGTLKPGMDAIDLIGATFPGGSITGAPKLRAMDIITEIEGDARELYCGAIGAIGFDGSLDTSIAIRTVFMNATTAVLQAGGGVTLLSEPKREYEETLTKAARVFEAFDVAGDGPR